MNWYHGGDFNERRGMQTLMSFGLDLTFPRPDGDTK
jgi:hypothetical protein